MMLGDWDYEFHKFDETSATLLLSEAAWLQILFFLYTIISVILLLNMIIAMMGGTFERVNERAEGYGTIVQTEQVT